jgi:Ca2+-binding EF-hand superfamily protein
MSESKSETELYLTVYHYPLDVSQWYKYYDDWRVRRAFYFEPRIFKAGGVTDKALSKVVAFIEEKLSASLRDVEITVEVDAETEELEMKGSVSLSSSVLRVRNFSELQELYRKLYDKLSKRYKKVKVLIKFIKPIKIPLTKEDYKRLFEELLNTDAQLNCQTARKLFGKKFAEKISEHNRQIRASKN